ncbi:hypothetical protein C4577_07740 [Candidatus Parcubacteria bacterium]|nr:MAG: hypothetical protein C4577_07740 [Candidatus Parcubacteria bacterium]
MKRIIKTIFPIFSQSRYQQSENQKVSYWLEKLFNQERKKEDVTLRDQTKTQMSAVNLVSSNAQNIKQTTEEKGLEEAIINHAGKAEKNRQAVEDMVNSSNRILLKISSVFPWDFFPSSIIVEETRLTIIHRQLFSSQVHSVDIKDISNIFVDTGILFAQLAIVSNTFAQNQIIINRLWKKEAIFMRRIVEGLRMFINKDIDMTSYKPEELINKLRELSTTKIVL